MNFETSGQARLVVLTKMNLHCKLRTEQMNIEIPSIWLEFPRPGQKPFVLGCYYREHTILNLPQPNLSNDPKLQRIRWAKFLDQWASSKQGMDIMVAGDLNLDHLKWISPEQKQKYMIEDTRNKIENYWIFPTGQRSNQVLGQTTPPHYWIKSGSIIHQK